MTPRRLLPFLVVATVLLTAGLASANPTPDPKWIFHALGASIITLASFAMELLVAMFILRHRADVTLVPGVIVCLVLLNAFTYWLVLIPLVDWARNIVVAEIGVLAVEGVAYYYMIRFFNGDAVTWRRAFVYALLANLASIASSIVLRKWHFY